MLASSSSRIRRRLALGRVAATLFVAAAIGTIASDRPRAQETERSEADTARYNECMALARANPERAIEVAAQWRATGGGGLARHCAAIALIAVGAEANAAEALTDVGVQGDGLSDEDRQGALMLAGELWLRLEQPELARRTFAASVEIGGAARRSSIGWARAEAMEGRWSDAVSALDPVIADNSSDIEALILRAAARRSAGDAEGALADATRAVEIAPEIALAWFERGAAERALGDRAAARRSWLEASRLEPEGPMGQPGGVAGEMARRNLERDALGE